MIIPPHRLSAGHEVGLMKLCRISAAEITRAAAMTEIRIGIRHCCETRRALFAANRDPPVSASTLRGSEQLEGDKVREGEKNGIRRRTFRRRETRVELFCRANLSSRRVSRYRGEAR